MTALAVPTANDLYHTAQILVRAGQPVFPVRRTYVDSKRRAKTPLTSNGFIDATMSVAQVKMWWKRHGTAAIGTPTGVLWDVLDVDVKRGQDGRHHLPRLTELGLLNGCKRVVKTPSGGWHLYFRVLPGHTNPNTANAGLGLDIRSKGGYVLAPGSYIDMTEDPDGGYAGMYEELDEPTDSTDDPLYWDLLINTLAPINSLTREAVSTLGYERQGSLASLRGWLSEKVVEGERNNSLHWAVCRCIENGIDPNELMEVATLIGLGEDEAQKTINSALKRAGVAVEELESEAESLFPEDI